MSGDSDDASDRTRIGGAPPAAPKPVAPPPAAPQPPTPPAAAPAGEPEVEDRTTFAPIAPPRAPSAGSATPAAPAAPPAAPASTESASAPAASGADAGEGEEEHTRIGVAPPRIGGAVPGAPPASAAKAPAGSEAGGATSSAPAAGTSAASSTGGAPPRDAEAAGAAPAPSAAPAAPATTPPTPAAEPRASAAPPVASGDDVTRVFSPDDTLEQTVILPRRVESGISLRRVAPSGREQTVVLDRPNMSVGRGQGCDVALVTPTASRMHARVWLQDGVWMIMPVDGKTLYANGKRYIDTSVKLEHDMRLRLGDDEFVVVDERAAAAPPPRPGLWARLLRLFSRSRRGR